MRQHEIRWSALLIAALMLLATLIVPAGAGGEYTSPKAVLIRDEFEDLETKRDLFFEGPGFNNRSAVKLPNHAFVDSATLNMSFGTYPGTQSAPWDPSLDVGEDGAIDWAFDSDRGGPLGLQDRFANGEKSMSFKFNEGGSRLLYVNLPWDAQIKRAYLDLEGYPIPTWVKQYPVTPRTDSPGEYGPKMVEYDGDLWVIWQSEDQNITTGDDADVVVRMFDGETGRWDRIIELSEAWDTDEDDIPQIINFKDKLYAIWSKGDGWATVGGHSELVYRVYDGTSWSDIERISGPKERGLNTYERCTVFKDKLYVVWKTTDPDVSEHAAWTGDDLDIVYRAFDGDSWSSIVEITASDNDDADWSVDVCVFRGMLYVVWDTFHTGITGWFGNSDVVYRAFDGRTWTSRKNLSPLSDGSLSSYETRDALPRMYVYANPVTKEDELFAIWMRGNTILHAAGNGYHIVYRRYTGSDWTPMEQLSFTPSGDPVDQMFPSLVEFNETLYAIWTIGTNTTQHGEGDTTLIATYGDIIIRSFDGERWSPLLELTPWGNGYDDASHPSIYIFDGKLYAAWETPLKTGRDSISWEIVMRHLEIAPVNLSIEMGEGEPLVWGPERLSNIKRRVHFDPDALTKVLRDSPYTMDAYGNRYAELPIKISDEAAANVLVSNLTIEYDFSTQVEFTSVADEVVAAHRDNTHVDKDVRVVFKVSTGQAGRVSLEDPVVMYKLDYPPLLEVDVPEQQMLEDEGREYLVDLEEYFTDDWDDGNLRFTITFESDETRVDAYLLDGWLSIRLPEVNFFGEARVTVRAHDRHDFYYNDSNEIVIQVLPVNDAPILTFVSDKELELDVDHVEYLSATDPDDPVSELRYNTDSDYIKVNPQTGRLEFTPRVDLPRPINFNVSVEDPQGASDWQEVTFNFTYNRVFIESEDDFPFALLLLLLLILALVAVERLRRPYRMTEEEMIWDEEAEWEEVRRAEESGSWIRRYF